MVKAIAVGPTPRNLAIAWPRFSGQVFALRRGQRRPLRSDDGIDLPRYDEYGNPSGAVMRCHVCRQDIERPDMAKCDARRRGLPAVPEPDKVDDQLLPANA